MIRYTMLVLAAIALGCVFAQDTFTVQLTKEYNNKLKLADDEGRFYMNPSLSNLAEMEEADVYEAQIINQNDLLYYGNLWFFLSDPESKHQFIFDTGSSWLWAGVEGCEGCPSTEKLPQAQITNCTDSQSLHYGSGSINGDVCQTRVSVTHNKDQSVNDMRMISVKKAALEGMSNTDWDGIVGLLPTSDSGADLLVNVMKQQGVIQTAAFTVNYVDSKYGSTITFGGFDKEYVSTIDQFTFTELYDHSYWSVGLRRIKYGDVEIGGEAERGIIDTGSSLLLLPHSDYSRWFEEISKGKKCGDYSGYKGCYCSGIEDFEDIYIMFNNWEYKIAPEQYIAQTNSNGEPFCYFLVGKLGAFTIPTAVLGDAFIRNYHIYHDVDNKRVGLYGDYMKYYETEESYTLYIIIAVCVVGVIALGVVLYFVTKDKNKEQVENEDAREELLDEERRNVEMKDDSA